MNFLFLDAYFEPEQTSFTHLESDLLDCLLKSGNKIKIVCPVPTRGITAETKREYKTCKRELRSDGVSVIRFSAPGEGKNAILRAFRYFWCNFRTLGIGKKCKDADIVFSNSTPPTQGFIAARVSKKLGVPFVYNLQDIFPDSLVNAGMAKKGSLLYKFGRIIEDYTYKNADKIIVIGENFKENIMGKGVPESKIEVIHNWIDTEKVRPVSREDNTLFDEFGIDRGKFTVVYAGNFGATQGTEVLVKAAELLRNRSDIHFILFGGGSEFESTKEIIDSKKLNNVTIRPLLPPELVPEVYSMGDVALITCKTGVGKAAIPSKTWSIMACGTPIIASFDADSELAGVLKKSGAGICVEPENAMALAEAITDVKNGKYVFSDGRDYAIKNADKKTCLKRYSEVFMKIPRSNRIQGD